MMILMMLEIVVIMHTTIKTTMKIIILRIMILFMINMRIMIKRTRAAVIIKTKQ